MTKTPRIGYRALSGIDTENIGEGLAKGTVKVTEDHLNRGGIMHGGAIATICDSTMGRAVGTTLEPGQSTATASMTMTYLASAKPGDELTATATVRKRSRQTVVVEAEVVRDGDQRPIAHSIATFIILARRD